MKSIIKNDIPEQDSGAEITVLKNRITGLEALVKYYEEQFRLAKHKQFGSSSEKSEYDLNQINLFNEAEATADVNVPEPEFVEVEKHYRKRKRSASDRLPEDLPIEVIEHELPSDGQVCSECGGVLHVMGHEIRRELKIIPAQAKVVEHRLHIYSCRSCEKNNDHTPIVKAEMPEPVIKGSFASAESVAHIMTQKFVMSVPLYRQEQEWNRTVTANDVKLAHTVRRRLAEANIQTVERRVAQTRCFAR